MGSISLLLLLSIVTWPSILGLPSAPPTQTPLLVSMSHLEGRKDRPRAPMTSVVDYDKKHAELVEQQWGLILGVIVGILTIISFALIAYTLYLHYRRKKEYHKKLERDFHHHQHQPSAPPTASMSGTSKYEIPLTKTDSSRSGGLMHPDSVANVILLHRQQSFKRYSTHSVAVPLHVTPQEMMIAKEPPVDDTSAASDVVQDMLPKEAPVLHSHSWVNESEDWTGSDSDSLGSHSSLKEKLKSMADKPGLRDSVISVASTVPEDEFVFATSNDPPQALNNIDSCKTYKKFTASVAPNLAPPLNGFKSSLDCINEEMEEPSLEPVPSSPPPISAGTDDRHFSMILESYRMQTSTIPAIYLLDSTLDGQDRVVSDHFSQLEAIVPPTPRNSYNEAAFMKNVPGISPWSKASPWYARDSAPLSPIEETCSRRFSFESFVVPSTPQSTPADQEESPLVAVTSDVFPSTTSIDPPTHPRSRRPALTPLVIQPSHKHRAGLVSAFGTPSMDSSLKPASTLASPTSCTSMEIPCVPPTTPLSPESPKDHGFNMVELNKKLKSMEALRRGSAVSEAHSSNAESPLHCRRRLMEPDWQEDIDTLIEECGQVPIYKSESIEKSSCVKKESQSFDDSILFEHSGQELDCDLLCQKIHDLSQSSLADTCTSSISQPNTPLSAQMNPKLDVSSLTRKLDALSERVQHHTQSDLDVGLLQMKLSELSN